MYSRSIVVFFLTLLMPVLCQSSRASGTFDEKGLETPKAVNVDPSAVYAPVLHHVNGQLCWKDPNVYSDSFSPNGSGIVYYSNGQICWKDPKVYRDSLGNNHSGIIYYSNGHICWKDPKIYRDSWGSNHSGIVYYPNGQICWKDPQVYQDSWGNNHSGIIYHSNGQICWKDPQVYQDSWGNNHSGIIYHSNGQICWKDPQVYQDSWGNNHSGIIYHSNGQICWKDPFLYSDGGQYFDSTGKRVGSGLNNTVSLQLGDNSNLEVSNGQFKITIDMGKQNYFVRFYDSEIAVFQNLGSSLCLYMPCLESTAQSVWIFDNYNNWMMISKNQ